MKMLGNIYFGTVQYASFLTLVLIFSGQIMSQPAVGIEVDTATVDGIRVNGANDDGIQVENCEFGLFVKHTSNVGVLVQDVDEQGLGIFRTGSDGIFIKDSGDDGIEIDGGRIGAVIKNTLNTGMLIQGALGRAWISTVQGAMELA